MPGIIISVVNNKGGVGKTTISCNLGVALTRLDKRVLVIDLDSQCNATGILLSNNTMTRNTLYELTDPNKANPPPVENCIHLSKYKGLYCLPNVEETSGLEMDLISHYPASLMILRNKVRDWAKKHFHFTIIDNPPNMGVFVANSLYASDFVIVPNDAGSAYSFDGLRKALELISSIRASGNPDLKFLRLLINRVDLRTSISRVIIHDITERFSKSQIFNTLIPANTAFQEAEYARETVFRHHSTTRAAKAYRQLAKEFLSVCADFTDSSPKRNK